MTRGAMAENASRLDEDRQFALGTASPVAAAVGSEVQVNRKATQKVLDFGENRPVHLRGMKPRTDASE